VVHYRLGVMRLAAVAGAASLALLTSACGQPPGPTSAAPPTKVCGTVLSDSPAGWVVADATRHLPTITAYTGNGVLIFRVARGCDQGARVSWTPVSAAHVIKTVHAKDGGVTAVVMRPNVPNAAFRLTATENGKVVASATVHLLEP
jgi:hypothetical protein